MTINPAFPLESCAALPGNTPAALRRMILLQAQEYGMPRLEDSPERVTVDVPGYGHYHFELCDGRAEITVSAAMHDRLFMLKEGFAEQLKLLQPEAANNLRWSGTGAAGTLPPNVHFTTVLSVVPVGRCFLRVRVQGGDLSGFQEDALHFRLLLPTAACQTPEWPRLGENGATPWPKEDKALHRPVYTTRWICQKTGEMEFDVFVHDGGRGTGWVRQAAVGDLLAIAGTGGGIPETSRILTYANETALPAAARILESLPADSLGKATLLADGGESCGYPVPAPDGIEVTWLSRDGSGNLAERALAERGQYPGYFLWFACEKGEAQHVRAALKAERADPKTSYIAAYWSQ